MSLPVQATGALIMTKNKHTKKHACCKFKEKTLAHSHTLRNWVCGQQQDGCFSLCWRQEITSWPDLRHPEKQRWLVGREEEKYRWRGERNERGKSKKERWSSVHSVRQRYDEVDTERDSWREDVPCGYCFTTSRERQRESTHAHDHNAHTHTHNLSHFCRVRQKLLEPAASAW